MDITIDISPKQFPAYNQPTQYPAYNQPTRPAISGANNQQYVDGRGPPPSSAYTSSRPEQSARPTYGGENDQSTTPTDVLSNSQAVVYVYNNPNGVTMDVTLPGASHNPSFTPGFATSTPIKNRPNDSFRPIASSTPNQSRPIDSFYPSATSTPNQSRPIDRNRPL